MTTTDSTGNKLPGDPTVAQDPPELDHYREVGMDQPALRAEPAMSADMPAPADTDPIILRYVGAGYYSVGGLPARDLRQSDFVATHWTVEEALKVQPPLYELAEHVDRVQADGMPVRNPATQPTADAAKD